jgi:hypothetical protein
MSAGPDFICIGLPKAGTGWLFDQVQYHPDFWMPPLKEIHYLDREKPKLKNVKMRLEWARADSEKPKEEFPHRRRGDERDREFLSEAAALSSKPMSFDSYAALFRFKRDLLSGDVTPAYASLNTEIIEQIGQHFPNVRIVLLLRDPVSRAWSHISMAHRMNRFDATVLDNAAVFAQYLKGWRTFQKVSFPARTAKRWEHSAPQIPFRHFFLDDIATHPEETRAAILEFIGADPKKSSGDIPPGLNKKSQSATIPLPDNIKAVLVELFADEIRACAKRFGGHALTWAATHGITV